MPFAGYLVSTGTFTLFWAATAGALGCNLGSTLAYWAGARGGRPLVERWGRYIFLSHAELDRADAYFARWARPPSSSAACCQWCAPSSRSRPGSPE